MTTNERLAVDDEGPTEEDGSNLSVNNTMHRTMKHAGNHFGPVRDVIEYATLDSTIDI